jgi:hypothetical protein
MEEALRVVDLWFNFLHGGQMIYRYDAISRHCICTIESQRQTGGELTSVMVVVERVRLGDSPPSHMWVIANLRQRV